MRTLNDYILQACIHSGTSKVFRAYQNSIHREVAVKVYPATYANHPESIRHFEVNVQFYARLTHPHIVPFYDAWRQPDEAYVVMPLLNSSLASLLNSAHWTPQAIVRLLDQLASALSLLHQHHLVHGNLSAEHVLLDEDHNAYLTGLRVLPHIHELEVHAAHELRLAAHSMAESHAAAVAQADILALARLAQMLLVQSYKRNGRSVPVALGEVLHTATAAEPSHRYATIADFAAALNAALPDRYSVSHQPLVHPLTNRELDVLRLMVEGLANKEIAERLVFSEGTVKWYIQQVYTKLSVHNRQQAIQRALRLGLLADGRQSALSDAGIEGARLSVQDSPCSGQDVRAVENPYKGLRAFEEPDAPDFFGREMLLDQFIAHMASAPGNASPLIVVGPSGCGKSSLIRAGLFPRLRAGALPGSSRWFFAMMTPGSSPFAALAAALLKVAVQPVEDLAALLEAGSHSLPSIIERLLPSGDGALVLFIDQFEEIFTLVEHETLRARFIQTIVEACTDARDRVHVVVALRADFYDRPLAYGSLAALMQTSTRLIAPMTGKELETAITGPAKRVGIAFEVGLVGAILHDLKDQAGALPLLQFTVTELFEQRTGNTLTIEAYRRQGGVSGALVRRAEALFGEMDAASQAALRQAFLRLVTPGDGSGDTRRRAPLAELYSAFQNETVLDDILSAFASRRLLTFDHDPLSRQPVVEVAHEALIREWPRFQQWVEQDRHNLQLARQMRAAVQEWLNAGRDRSFLASGGRLAQFLVLRDSLRLTQDERDYLDASAAHEAQAEAEKQAHRRRIALWRQVAMGILSLGLLVTVSLLIIALRNHQEALTQADIAVSHYLAARSAIEWQEPLGNDEFVALLAIRALEKFYEPVADRTLTAVVERLPVRTFPGSASDVQNAVFSPDGAYVLTGRPDHSVQLFDAQTGELVRAFEGHQGEIWRVAFSPDGARILSASEDGTVRVWDVRTGEQVFHLEHASGVRAAVFVPPGDRIATADYDGVLRLWNAQTGVQTDIFEDMHAGDGLAVAPDSRLIAFPSAENTATVLDVNARRAAATLRGHTGPVYSVTFSPDAQRVLTGSSDNTARLWDATTGELLRTYEGHSSSVRSVAFSPDGRLMLTASGDYTVRLWEVSTGEQIGIWRGHTERVWSAVFSPDASFILTSSVDGTNKLWSARPTPPPALFAEHGDEVFETALSANGRFALSGGADHVARLWDVETGRIVHTLRGHRGTVSAVAISSSGGHLLTASVDGTAIVWSAETGESLFTFESTAPMRAAAISPDDRYAITGGDDGLVTLWELAAGQQIRTFTHPASSSVLSLAFSPDGERVLAGVTADRAFTWDVQSGQMLAVFEGHADSVWSAAYSPDGRYVLTGSRDATVRLWEAATGQLVRESVGHNNTVFSVAFSRDGQHIVSGSADRTIRVWDVASGEEQRTLTGHTGAVESALFLPDGRRILSAGLDGTLRLWPTDYRDLIRAACARLSRDFTEVERAEIALAWTEPTCAPQ